MPPGALMRISPTYAAWRGFVVRMLAWTAPEVVSFGRRSREERRSIWAHADPDAFAQWKRKQTLILPRVVPRYRADGLSPK